MFGGNRTNLINLRWRVYTARRVEEKMITISKGNPLKPGADKIARTTYNFSFACGLDTAALLIYDSGKNLKRRFELDKSYKTGNVFSCVLSGENLDKAMYCYELDGKTVVDPYAKTVTCCTGFGIEDEDKLFLSRIVLDNFDWEGDAPLELPYEDSIFYKIHVRGFTKSRTSGVKHKGTFAGITEKVDYLKKLGITTLELMPAYEYDEMYRFPQFYTDIQGRYDAPFTKIPVNYWGYCPAFHFAPKASFSSISSAKSDYTTEFKKMVKLLHKNGIEVIMEMYFDRETPELVLDCIRYWVTQYHIDGVHLYAGASALDIAANDPVLSRTKIITVFWDGNRGSMRHMASYNDGFSGTVRRFLKGDENQLGDFINVTRNNPHNAAVINYVTNHNGFTLNDLVSFERKHNEANGENNRDGENFNYSWNCGIEGKSRKKRIVQLRQKQMKNALMMLMFSAGTPLILGGDEFENSQGGNNNPYCIDSETSWLNWKRADEACDMTAFVEKLIEFRRSHRILHMREQLLSSDPVSCGYPDVSYHGSGAWYQVTENFNRHIGIMYCGRYAGSSDSYELIYIAYNMHWEEHGLALPKIPADSSWETVICSGDIEDVHVLENRTVRVAPRTSAVMLAVIRGASSCSEKRGQRSKNKVTGSRKRG